MISPYMIFSLNYIIIIRSAIVNIYYVILSKKFSFRVQKASAKQTGLLQYLTQKSHHATKNPLFVYIVLDFFTGIVL